MIYRTGNIATKLYLLCLRAFVFFFLSIASIHAQTSSVSQTVEPSITNSIAIIFTGTGTATGSSVSIPFSSASDYANGVSSSVQGLEVQSNNSFNVTVKVSSTNFTYTGSTSPSPTMPVSSVLYMQVTSNSTGGTVASSFNAHYNNLSTTAQNLITGGTAGGSQDFSIQYFAQPGFTYPSGNYTTTVTFTATQS
jgi:hypothetical protein